MNLNADDINALLEAVDAWKGKASSDAMFTAMLGMALIKDEAKATAMADEQFAKAKAGEQLRNERAIMLKAKLLMLRDRIEADEFAQMLQAPK